MRAAPKVILPILQCWPMTSEEDAGVWQYKLNVPTNIPLYLVTM